MLLCGLVTSPPSGQRPERPSDDAEQPPHGALALGMKLFLLALSVLFAASLVLYLITRARAAVWPPPGAPGLPPALWLSTALMLISSGTMHLALRAIRAGHVRALHRWMLVTAGLGLAFLVGQTANWVQYVQAIPPESLAPPRPLTDAPETARNDARLFYFLFFTLTGVHAAHVIGGLVAVGVVTVGALRQRYSRGQHVGVQNCAAYWHFLDVVWLVLMAAIVTL